MKYAIFAVALVAVFALIGYAIGLSRTNDPIMLGTYASTGAGTAIGGMFLGLIGLLYKKNRFIGFAAASIIIGGLSPLWMPAV